MFRAARGDLARLRLLPPGAAHHAAVGPKLDRLRGHRLTYVDASSLVSLKQYEIHEVWGTDGDLALDGSAAV